MIEINVTTAHPFFDDFDSMLNERKIVTGSMKYPDYVKLVKEVYEYDIYVDPTGTIANIKMTEQQHLLFLLKYE